MLISQHDRGAGKKISGRAGRRLMPDGRNSAELSARALADGGRTEKIRTTVYRSRSAIWMVLKSAGRLRILPAFTV